MGEPSSFWGCGPLHLTRERGVGLVLIFSTAVIWIASSFISNALVTGKGTNSDRVSPFLLTYLATSLFTLYLPLIHLRLWVQECFRTRSRTTIGGFQETNQADELKAKSYTTPSWLSSLKGSNNPSHQQFYHKPTMVAALWAAPLWFAAQFTFNTSLAATSVTSNTILSSTSSLFTFGFSILLLGEHYSWLKLLCCFACIAGTGLITLSDAESQSDPSALGDSLAVISAALYAAYTVVMRKKMPGNQAHEHVGLFFGYVGLLCTVALAPVVVILLGSGLISISNLPPTVFWLILVEGLLDYVLADYFWARAVLFLGPTVATLSLSIQIPMAAVADAILGSPAWLTSNGAAVMTLGGAILILAGFVGINLPGSQHQVPESLQDGLGGADTSELPLTKWDTQQGADEDNDRGGGLSDVQALLDDDETQVLLHLNREHHHHTSSSGSGAAGGSEDDVANKRMVHAMDKTRAKANKWFQAKAAKLWNQLSTPASSRRDDSGNGGSNYSLLPVSLGADINKTRR